MSYRISPSSLLIVAALTIAPSGCAMMIGTTATYTALNAAPRKCAQPRVEPSAIAIITGTPTSPHVEAGLIEISAVGTGAEATATALAHIRKEASAHGCHAARLGALSVKPGGEYGPSTNSALDVLDLMATDPMDRKLVNASCIVYLDTSCADRTGPSTPQVAAAAAPATRSQP
jgi:hypothetical protein